MGLTPLTKNMRNRGKFLVGGGLIVAVIASLAIYAGRQAVIYFVTPAELQVEGTRAQGKAYRLGGMVVQDSLKRDPQTLQIQFELTDGKATLPVTYRGIPPDLFAEGRGAVVEGIYQGGVFQASSIMAKHSEEYRAPSGKPEAGYRELLKTLVKPGEAKR